MEVEAVHAVAQGRVWTGAQALERGLVDELGGLDTAIAKARELAGVTEETGLLRLPRQRTVMEELLEDLQGGEEAGLARAMLQRLPGADARLRRVEGMLRVFESGGPAALLPCEITVR
jgi:protease-4